MTTEIEQLESLIDLVWNGEPENYVDFVDYLINIFNVSFEYLADFIENHQKEIKLLLLVLKQEDSFRELIDYVGLCEKLFGWSYEKTIDVYNKLKATGKDNIEMMPEKEISWRMQEQRLLWN